MSKLNFAQNCDSRSHCWTHSWIHSIYTYHSILIFYIRFCIRITSFLLLSFPWLPQSLHASRIVVSEVWLWTVHTVNSLLFAGINVCVFETKPCLWELIFAVGSGIVNYLGTWIMFAGTQCIYFRDLKVVTNISQINPSRTLLNLQYIFSHRLRFVHMAALIARFHCTVVTDVCYRHDRRGVRPVEHGSPSLRVLYTEGAEVFMACYHTTVRHRYLQWSLSFKTLLF